jgi:hypothetical protein
MRHFQEAMCGSEQTMQDSYRNLRVMSERRYHALKGIV